MKVLLIAYNNDSYIHVFPQGIAYIAAAIRNAGYDVEIYSQDVYRYEEEHLTRYLNKNKFDVVGIGIIAGYYQYRKLLKISAAINNSKNRPNYYILGGHGPTPEPEYFLKKTKADIVVMGEGEETIIEVLSAISESKDFKEVKGIAYRVEDKVIVNDRRAPIQDVDSILMPAYDMFPIHYYRLLRLPHSVNGDYVMPVLSARGCTFNCNFCYRMDSGYRPRKSEAIMEEIAYLQKDYGISYIDFTDELLMASKNRVVEFCGAIKKTKLRFKWFCSGRLNYATQDILKIMKDAGCVFINYGIESFDDDALRKMNKALTTRQITLGIEATCKVGISAGYNIIFGNIGENRETLKKGVEFLLKYDDGAQMRTIRPVTPYPGSPLYYHAIEKGILKDVEDFYENKHINSDLLSVNFTDMCDEEFYTCLMEANTALLENYYKNKLKEVTNITRNLYLNKDVSFRGYRQT